MCSTIMLVESYTTAMNILTSVIQHTIVLSLIFVEFNVLEYQLNLDLQVKRLKILMVQLNTFYNARRTESEMY